MSHELIAQVERDLAELELLRKRVAELESVLAMYATPLNWTQQSRSRATDPYRWLRVDDVNEPSSHGCEPAEAVLQKKS